MSVKNKRNYIIYMVSFFLSSFFSLMVGTKRNAKRKWQYTGKRSQRRVKGKDRNKRPFPKDKNRLLVMSSWWDSLLHLSPHRYYTLTGEIL